MQTTVDGPLCVARSAVLAARAGVGRDGGEAALEELFRSVLFISSRIWAALEVPMANWPWRLIGAPGSLQMLLHRMFVSACGVSSSLKAGCPSKLRCDGPGYGS